MRRCLLLSIVISLIKLTFFIWCSLKYFCTNVIEHSANIGCSSGHFSHSIMGYLIVWFTVYSWSVLCKVTLILVHGSCMGSRLGTLRHGGWLCLLLILIITLSDYLTDHTLGHTQKSSFISLSFTRKVLATIAWKISRNIRIQFPPINLHHSLIIHLRYLFRHKAPLFTHLITSNTWHSQDFHANLSFVPNRHRNLLQVSQITLGTNDITVCQYFLTWLVTHEASLETEMQVAILEHSLSCIYTLANLKFLLKCVKDWVNMLSLRVGNSQRKWFDYFCNFDITRRCVLLGKNVHVWVFGLPHLLSRKWPLLFLDYLTDVILNEVFDYDGF